MDGQNNSPVPGSPEYNTQMSQLGENVTINSGNAVPTKGGDPASTTSGGEFDGLNKDNGGEKLLAGKFKTVEELEAAFQQLQAQGETKGATEENPQDQNQEQNQADPAKATEADAKEALQNVGLNFDEFSNEFANSGTLSEASYKKLADAGIPKEVVDAYIEGQQAKADLVVEKVVSSVGGMETYSKMIEWAKANLSAEEIAAYDKVATQGDPYTAQLAAEGLYRRYTNAVGTNNRFITGSTNNVATDVFHSTAQITQAMRDPRYRSDPAYRREVAEKLARSNIL